MTSRRDFVETTVALGAALSLPRRLPAPPPRGFVDLHRQPDSILAQAEHDLVLTRADNHWTNGAVSVTTDDQHGALRVQLAAPGVAVKRIRLRWRGSLSGVRQIMGDAWERGYGDLEWRGWVTDRVMPWYAATHDASLTHAYGVRTGANAFCYWHLDEQGVTLWADVRSGSTPVELGERTLDVCDVVCRAGKSGESAFQALHAFCRQMCEHPRIPKQPVYGHNDWYWAYGKINSATVMVDAHHIAELSPAGGNRPFAVIDDGWQPVRGAEKKGVGLWDSGNERFPDMPDLANSIKNAGARPGIWIRPLQAPTDAPDTWRSARDKQFLDPTVSEVKAKVAADVTRLTQWGFELIKHDYTTFDIFGRWGFQMGSALTRDGWTFAEGPKRTTAEVINDLYATIRDAAGESLVIGCNTVSHLSAGQFEICRVGDDTSGTEWARTRKMGVNSLAFRGAQHGAFYVADADCVGVTNAVPWKLNRQWLDLLARSGTMLFVSLDPEALGADQKRDLKNALALAAVPHALGEPLDWQRTVYPERWRMMGREVTYDWTGSD